MILSSSDVSSDPAVGATTVTSLVAAGDVTAGDQLISTVATGTAPLSVASTTAVANLNASLLLGKTWAAPDAIGGTTPAAITGTTVTGTGKVIAYSTATVPMVIEAALAAVDTAGGVYAWENTTTKTVWVLALHLDVTTKTTDGVCTVDAGIAADGTTSNDSLIDGQDIGAAIGIFTSTTVPKKVTAGQFITISKATGETAGLVGKVLILAYVAD